MQAQIFWGKTTIALPNICQFAAHVIAHLRSNEKVTVLITLLASALWSYIQVFTKDLALSV